MAPSSEPRSRAVLLACDLDGTLLDHEGEPVPGVGEALGELVGAGVRFAVVTGRSLQAARRAAAALGVEPALYACCHGALIADTRGHVLRHVPLPRREADGIAAAALAAGAGVTVWDVDEPRELRAGDRSALGQGRRTRAAATAPAGGPLGDQVSRLILHGDGIVVARLLGELRQGWAGRLQVRPARPGFIEVVALEVDKGDALRFVARRLGVPLERTVACGDESADESLLAAAAVRVAVGESPHALGHLPGVRVTDRAGLPAALRSAVLSVL